MSLCKPYKIWESKTWRNEKKNELFCLQETFLPFTQRISTIKRFRILFKEAYQIGAGDDRDEVLKLWEWINTETKKEIEAKKLKATDEEAILHFLAHDLELRESWTAVAHESQARKLVPQFNIIDDYEGGKEEVKSPSSDPPLEASQPISASPLAGLFMSYKMSFDIANQSQLESQNISFDESVKSLSSSQNSGFAVSEVDKPILKKASKLWPDEKFLSIHDCELQKLTAVPGKLLISEQAVCFMDTLPALSSEHLLSAFLGKKGKVKWNRYLVKITPTSIEYYVETDKSHEPKGTLAAHLIESVDILDDGDIKHPDKFVVRVKGGKEHVFATDNQVQLQQWSNALRTMADKSGNFFRIPFVDIKDMGFSAEFLNSIASINVQNDPVTYIFTSIKNFEHAKSLMESRRASVMQDGVTKFFTEEKNSSELYFARLFPTLKDEKLESYFTCSLFRTLIPVPGHLYITKKHICFHCITVWQNYKTVQVVIGMKEITSVEIDSMFSLWISTLDGDRFQFINCWKNQECKKLIESLMSSADLGKSIQISALEPGIVELPQAPKWNPGCKIVFLTIGSRGDVQPYMSLAKRLKQEGYKIKIVTHAVFEKFIQETDPDFEFGVIGGDPKLLMDLCVKNGMFTPSFVKEALANFMGFIDEVLENSLQQCKGADLIISPPIVMSAFHVAEKLKVPLINTFTMPYSKTSYYPHPFMIPDKPLGSLYNSLTYTLMQNVLWLPMQNQINSWRVHNGLESISGDFMHSKKIPFLYCFSKYLVPKPPDWGDEIKVSGFWFIDQGSKTTTTYKPSPELEAFLTKKDPRPLVYIGFGSIVISDPDGLTKLIFGALKKAGVRAILVKGWGGLGNVQVPENVFQINAIPHEWLFPQMAAVIHHGGAGTTAIGLRSGKPTVIVPFFGDQYFWGQRIAELGVGTFVNSKYLTEANLSDAITFATRDTNAQAAAKRLGEQIHSENGIDEAVKTIYTYAPYAYIPPAPKALESRVKCSRCSESFLRQRKVNCHHCGEVFCEKCCNHRVRIEKFLIRTPVQICLDCFQHLSQKPSNNNNHM